MNLQNGYRVIYEKAADGMRTFFASKRDGSADTEIASFTDADYADRIIYEYKGGFYVSATGKAPAYDENGVPTDERLSAFDQVFVEDTATPAMALNEEEDEPAVPAVEPKDDEPKTNSAPEDDE